MIYSRKRFIQFLMVFAYRYEITFSQRFLSSPERGRMKLRRDDQGIVLMGIYEFLEDSKMLDA